LNHKDTKITKEHKELSATDRLLVFSACTQSRKGR